MFCGNCGKEAKSGNRFCVYCGERLEQSNIPVTVSQYQPTVARTFRLTIVRPKSVFGCAMTFNIFLDGSSEKHTLKNGQQITFELASGVHTIEVGMIGVFQRTKVTVNVAADKRIVCTFNPAGTITNGLAAGPAILEDEYGVRL